MPQPAIPKATRDWFDRCVAALNLAGWDLTLLCATDIDGDSTIQGQAAVSYRYASAIITVRYDLDKATMKVVIAHELIHVLNAAQLRAAIQLIALLPDDQRKWARELFDDSNELATELQARVIVPLAELIPADQLKPIHPTPSKRPPVGETSAAYIALCNRKAL